MIEVEEGRGETLYIRPAPFHDSVRLVCGQLAHRAVVVVQVQPQARGAQTPHYLINPALAPIRDASCSRKPSCMLLSLADSW